MIFFLPCIFQVLRIKLVLYVACFNVRYPRAVVYAAKMSTDLEKSWKRLKLHMRIMYL